MTKKTSLILTLTGLLLAFTAQAAKLNTGPWRFELKLLKAEVPFIVNLNRSGDTLSGVLHNGKETIKLQNIKLTDKTLTIPLQTYELSLEMELDEKDVMSGYLVRHNKDPVMKTPVFAVHGESERFPEEKSKPQIDLTGRWSVTMVDDDQKQSTGVLIFNQNKNELNGSLLTPTGDYRYFEGFVSNTEFEAASFDGVYNYLIRGKVKDGKLEAQILDNSALKITGKKDAHAELPDAYKQTQLPSLSFTFPDLEGKKVSLTDEKFKGKPVIIQFFGSWCPNCMDETNYLIPWYEQNKQRGIEIVALAFERSLSEKGAKVQLRKVQKAKNIPYTLLLAGSTSADKPMDKIKNLKNFISFPTTVFLDKEHKVVKVHAGFTGPGTGEFYEKWQKEFTQTVEDLLK